MMSTAPPGGNGTRMCTGAEGKRLSRDWRAAAASSRNADRAPARLAHRQAASAVHHSSPAKTRLAFAPARGYTAWDKTSQGNWGVAFMADGTKRVFSVNGPAHPIFTEIIGKRSRHPLRHAQERQPGRCRDADPRGRACLSDRLGARRARQEVSRRAGPAAPHAKPADRLDQRRRLRHREPEGLHRSRHAVRSTRPAATRRRSPSTRSP